MVQAIHCTVPPVQACEASPQRAWRLGTAATGSPGLMTGQSFGMAPPWPLLQGNWEQVLSASVPRGTQSSSQNELHPPPHPHPSSFPYPNQASDP